MAEPLFPERLEVIRAYARQFTDLRGATTEPLGKRHRLGFLMSPDHVAALRHPLFRLEGLYENPEASPFAASRVHVSLLIESNLALRSLKDPLDAKPLQELGAKCIYASYAAAWLDGEGSPNVGQLCARLAGEPGLHLQGRVNILQTTLEAPELDTVFLLVWIAPSHHEGPAFIAKLNLPA